MIGFYSYTVPRTASTRGATDAGRPQGSPLHLLWRSLPRLFCTPRQLTTLFNGTPVSLYTVQDIVYHSRLAGGFFGGGFGYGARRAAIKAPTPRHPHSRPYGSKNSCEKARQRQHKRRSVTSRYVIVARNNNVDRSLAGAENQRRACPEEQWQHYKPLQPQQ